MVTIYKETTTHTIGCPEDESESTSETYKFHFVDEYSESEVESFGEYQVSAYENNDYSVKTSFRKVLCLDDDEFKTLAMEIKRRY